jgi:hypothetical protein
MKAIGITIKHIPELCCNSVEVTEGDNVERGLLKEDFILWQNLVWSLTMDKDTVTDLVLIKLELLKTNSTL